MKKRAIQLISVFIILSLLLIGCATNSEESKATGFSNNKQQSQSIEIPQGKADKVKEKLEELKEVNEAHVVTLNDEIFVSLSVSGHHRFFLQRIREDVHELTKKTSQAKEVHVSTDKKISMELEKLEHEIANGRTPKKDIEKKLKKIEKDMKG